MTAGYLDKARDAPLLGRCHFDQALARTASAKGPGALIAAIAAAHLGRGDEAQEHARRWGETNELAPSGGPLVSVIIPTHDRRELLARAIASVEAQTYRPLELIVVNDAGPVIDDLLPRPSAGLSWRLHHNTENLYHSRSRNAGLSLARGEWLLFLDDDDLLYPHHIAHLLAVAQRERVELVAGVSLLHRQGERETLSAWPARRFTQAELARQNVVPIQAVLLQRALQRRVGEFSSELSAFEDWDFWLRCAAEARRVAQTEVPTSCVDQRHAETRVSTVRAPALAAYERLLERQRSTLLVDERLRSHHQAAIGALRNAALADLARDRQLALVVFEHTPPLRGWASGVARAMAPLAFAEDWGLPLATPWAHALALERLFGQSRADLLVVIDPALAAQLPAGIVPELTLALEADPSLAAMRAFLEGPLPGCSVLDRRAVRRVYAMAQTAGLSIDQQWERITRALRREGLGVGERYSSASTIGRGAEGAGLRRTIPRSSSSL